MTTRQWQGQAVIVCPSPDCTTETPIPERAPSLWRFTCRGCRRTHDVNMERTNA